MINPPINSLPAQQAAVAQQIQQNQVPMMRPAFPPQEFNAIKINILGANVSAPGQTAPALPAPVQQGQENVYVPQPEVGQRLNYVA